MKLRQPEKGFRYNTDSVLLYHFAAQRRLKGRLLDVGCGCGVVGLLLARDFGVELTGVDVQAEMIGFARENGEMNGINAQFHHTDFREFSSETKFDAIVCNPPFYHPRTQPSENPSLRLARYGDALPIDAFLKQAGRLIDPRGDLFFCYDAAAFYPVIKLLGQQRYHLKTVQFVHRDASTPARLVLIHAKKSLVKATQTLPPLFLHDESQISAPMNAIAQKAGTLCVA